MLTTAPALFTLEIHGQMDLFDLPTEQEAPAPAPDENSTYVAVLSNGRTVTHWARPAITHMVEIILTTGGTISGAWCVSAERAEQEAAQVRATWPHAASARVIPTTAYPHNSAEAEAARNLQKAQVNAAWAAEGKPLIVTGNYTPRKTRRQTPDPAHRTFVATLSSGRTVVRSSKTMDYTHLVEITTYDSGRPFDISWHKTVQAAQKAADRLRRGTREFPDVLSVRVQPVAAFQYLSEEAKAARARAGRAS